MPTAAKLAVIGAPATAIGLSSKVQLALVPRTLCATVVPVNTQVTGSPTLTVTAFGVQRLSLPSGSTPSTAWKDCSAAAVAGKARAATSAAANARITTTSNCSIIALSACSSAWQWKTYLPA